MTVPHIHPRKPLREVDESDEERAEVHSLQERRDRKTDHAPRTADDIASRIVSGVEAVDTDSPFRDYAIAGLRLHQAEVELETRMDEYNRARAALLGGEAA